MDLCNQLSLTLSPPVGLVYAEFRCVLKNSVCYFALLWTMNDERKIFIAK